MFFLRTASVIVLGAVLAGCQSMAGSQATARKIEAANPRERVGVVDQVLLDKPWISVQGLPVDRIEPGMVVTIVDQKQRPLTSGVVRDKQPAREGPRVQVEYKSPGLANRGPRRGDLVVWFADGKTLVEQQVSDATPQPTAQEATQRMRAHQMLESSPSVIVPSAAPTTQPAFR